MQARLLADPASSRADLAVSTLVRSQHQLTLELMLSSAVGIPVTAACSAINFYSGLDSTFAIYLSTSPIAHNCASFLPTRCPSSSNRRNTKAATHCLLLQEMFIPPMGRLLRQD